MFPRPLNSYNNTTHFYQQPISGAVENNPRPPASKWEIATPASMASSSTPKKQKSESDRARKAFEYRQANQDGEITELTLRQKKYVRHIPSETLEFVIGLASQAEAQADKGGKKKGELLSRSDRIDILTAILKHLDHLGEKKVDLSLESLADMTEQERDTSHLSKTDLRRVNRFFNS